MKQNGSVGVRFNDLHQNYPNKSSNITLKHNVTIDSNKYHDIHADQTNQSSTKSKILSTGSEIEELQVKRFVYYQVL